jgi:hypothetical protein
LIEVYNVDPVGVQGEAQFMRQPGAQRLGLRFSLE